jgi:hypothetical protein
MEDQEEGWSYYKKSAMQGYKWGHKNDEERANKRPGRGFT